MCHYAVNWCDKRSFYIYYIKTLTNDENERNKKSNGKSDDQTKSIVGTSSGR